MEGHGKLRSELVEHFFIRHTLYRIKYEIYELVENNTQLQFHNLLNISAKSQEWYGPSHMTGFIILQNVSYFYIWSNMSYMNMKELKLILDPEKKTLFYHTVIMN